jgi:hypothetical protein
MCLFEAEARFLHGDAEGALELIDCCWGSMIRKGAKTYWEFAPSDESQWVARNHGWSSGCTYVISAYVLGIIPSQYGWDKIKFDPKTVGFVRKHTPENISAMIAECKKAGFFVTYNHPAWSMENYEQYTRYEGLDAMEILNYSCERLGYPAYADLIYDDMLRANGKLFAIAADDNHDKYPPDSPYSDACGGYVMIKAKSLDYETVINALCAGDFYASGGPSIYELYLEDGRVHVSCSDAARITLNAGHRATKTVIAPDNATVNGAVFDYKEDDLYLRITVKDREGKCAFSNAYFL